MKGCLIPLILLLSARFALCDPVEIKADAFERLCTELGVYRYDLARKELSLVKSVKGSPRQAYEESTVRTFLGGIPGKGFRLVTFSFHRTKFGESFHAGGRVVKYCWLELDASEWPHWLVKRLKLNEDESKFRVNVKQFLSPDEEEKESEQDGSSNGG